MTLAGDVVAAHKSRARELSALAVAPIRFLLAVVLCLTPVTAIVVLGWLTRRLAWDADLRMGRRMGQRMGQRISARRPRLLLSDADEPKGWFRAWTGGLAANLLAGLKAWTAMLLLTLPFTAVWLTGWFAGWENSFNKGYETAGIWPVVTVLAVIVSLPVWMLLPMAITHQAVAERMMAAFQVVTITRLARAAGWRYLGLKLLIAVGCIGVFGARALPVFAENFSQAIASGDPEAAARFASGYRLATTGALLSGVLLVRAIMARVYASATDKLARGEGAGVVKTAFIAVLSCAIWLGLAFLVFGGQFLNFHWWAWINQPVLMLPWLGVVG